MLLGYRFDATRAEAFEGQRQVLTSSVLVLATQFWGMVLRIVKAIMLGQSNLKASNTLTNRRSHSSLQTTHTNAPKTDVRQDTRGFHRSHMSYSLNSSIPLNSPYSSLLYYSPLYKPPLSILDCSLYTSNTHLAPPCHATISPCNATRAEGALFSWTPLPFVSFSLSLVWGFGKMGYEGLGFRVKGLRV